MRYGDLTHDVRCRAKAPNTDAFRCGATRSAPSSVPDESRTEQWGRVRVVIPIWNDKAILLVRNSELCVAAIKIVPSKRCIVAEVFTLHPAKCAAATHRSEPGDTYALADRELSDCGSKRKDFTDNLMTWNHAFMARRKIGVDDMQISPAYTAGKYPD